MPTQNTKNTPALLWARKVLCLSLALPLAFLISTKIVYFATTDQKTFAFDPNDSTEENENNSFSLKNLLDENSFPNTEKKLSEGLSEQETLNQMSQQIIDLTNFDRAKNGLETLKPNSNLVLAAKNKALDMAKKSYFSHTSPEGINLADWLNISEYKYQKAGENLAVSFTETEAVEKAWMNSTGHRANILDPLYKEIGVGISEGQYKGKKVLFFVCYYGLPQ